MDNIVIAITAAMIVYGILAMIVFWQQRPGVGIDPNTGKYRAARQLWKERRR